MSSSMQPERSKSGKSGKSNPIAKRRRGLLGDPDPTQITATLTWSTGGVTAVFSDAVSSASWNSTAMSGSGTRWTGSGRNTNSTDAMSGTLADGTVYSNTSISDGTATSATLAK